MIRIIKPEYIIQDERGCLKQLVSKDWSQVNVIESVAGSVRGGHYHKNNEELFFVIKGRFILNLEENIQETFLFKENDMFIIEKNTLHSFIFKEDTLLVTMYSNGVIEGDKMDIYTKE